jgi:hypothetical protein
MDVGSFGHRLMLVRGFGAHSEFVVLMSFCEVGGPCIVAVLFVGIYHDAEITHAVAVLGKLRSHVMDMEERGHREVKKNKSDRQPALMQTANGESCNVRSRDLLRGNATARNHASKLP